jgi:Enolase, C-terminal TIM barrel domain
MLPTSLPHGQFLFARIHEASGLLGGSISGLACCGNFVWCHTREELIDIYNGFAKNYPIISIEDPFDQDDIEHCQKFTAEGVVQVCGPRACMMPPL